MAAYHAYASDGVYTVTVTVTDDDGAATADTVRITVENAGPQVNAGPDLVVTEGQLVSLAPAAFTDPGGSDQHTATIVWGYLTAVDACTVVETG